MKRRRKLKPTKSRKKPRSGCLPVIVILIAVAGGWLWWKNRPARAPLPASEKSFAQTAKVARPIEKISGEIFPHPVRNVLEAQVALERLHISSGSIDGVIGSQTRAAVRAFQRAAGLPESGLLDSPTRSNLLLTAPIQTTYIVSSNDFARLQPIGATWLAKSEQTALDFETILELVAEKSHSHPKLIAQLNPNLNWTNMSIGTTIEIPDVAPSSPTNKAAFAVLSLAGKTLDAFDVKTNLLAHFPCSIARQVEKRPVGELHVVVVAPNPNYTFDPEVFPESEEAQHLNTKLIVQPGPNNPVGVAWIGLDKPGYGIHGTPKPEDIGRTESHGCFRLANWNAEYLLKLVWIGMPIYVEP